MRPKDADRMANSVDPDQTAPLHCLPISRSSLIWVYTVCPGLLSENLGLLRYTFLLVKQFAAILFLMLAEFFIHFFFFFVTWHNRGLQFSVIFD